LEAGDLPDPGMIDSAVSAIRSRILPEGGFAAMNGGAEDVDSTAWAVTALHVHGNDEETVSAGRNRLTRHQWGDGRVAISNRASWVWWPTSSALLAWAKDREYEAAARNATGFLLATKGLHFPRRPDAPITHDTSIRGWSWTAGTHSWVEPTSLAVLALRAVGKGKHERVEEAVSMLMDRMLPSGGWNYGNTLVFGRELRPMPESTGAALDALAGYVPKERVQASLEYLKKSASRVRTPLALSWAILGLGAWDERPPDSEHRLAESVSRQSRYGPYTTALLSRIVVAFHAPRGLLSALQPEGDRS
jgi:hypothetical protein